MRCVIALEFKARAVGAALLEHELDVGKGVLENQVARAFQKSLLPGLLEIFVAPEHGKQTEVHRAHVERCHLGLQLQGRLHALDHRHGWRAAGGDVDDRVAALLDVAHKGAKSIGRLVRPAVFGLARMQMHDGRTGLSRAHGSVSNLLRADRQVGRHGRRVDRAGDGAGDDDFAVLAHGISLGFLGVNAQGQQMK